MRGQLFGNLGGKKLILRTAVIAWTLIASTICGTAQPQPSAGNKALPGKPSLSRVTPVSPFEIDLTWRDKSTNEAGFQIERGPDRNHFKQIAQVLPGTTIFRDKNLFPGTKYFYRIRSFNAAGSSAYSSESAKTQSPRAPLSIAEWDAFNYGTIAPTNTDFVSISAGLYHGLALKKNGTVMAWGDNTYGEAAVPTNLNGVIAISAGGSQSLALKNDGTVVEWGIDPGGQTNPVSGFSNVVAIAAGHRHSLALKNDGTVVGWGIDDGGDLTPPTNVTGVVEIAAGDGASLALKSDGTIVGWGNPQLGAVTPPANLTSAIALAAGQQLSMAVKSNGSVVAWGGYSNRTVMATSNLTGVTALALGWFEGVALRKDGSLFSWTLDNSMIDTPDLGNSAVAISANGYHQLVLCTAPAAPSNPFATVLSPTKVQISWTDNSSDEKSFSIERRQQTGNGPTPWIQIASLRPNTTNFVDATVVANTSYAYRIRALGGFGTSPYCPDFNVLLTPLPAPDSVFAELGASNLVNVGWYYSFQVDGYKIERAPDVNRDAGTWVEIGSVAQGSGQPEVFNDSTALPNNTYWYRIRAFNVLGFSDYSDPISFNVKPPATPQYFYGSPFADTISLTWYEEDTTRGVKLERAPDVNGNPGGWTQIAFLDVTNGDEYVDKGLTLNTTYWYRLSAFNWAGDSPYAGPIHVTVVPPAPPNPVSANVDGTNGVDISWSPNISDEDGFQLERAPDVSGGPGAWSQIGSFTNIHSNFELFQDTNVFANNTYWYRVRSFNLFGLSEYTTPVSVHLVPPTAPTLFAATSKADTVDLHWQTEAPNVLEFKIERAPDTDGSPGAWTQVATVPGANSSYTDTNLTGGVIYWYRMRSSNWLGESPYSNLTVVTIDPPAAPAISSLNLNRTNGVDILLYDGATDADFLLVERALPTALGFKDWKQIAMVNSARAAYTFYTDTNATPYATNFYRVRALNNAGTSDYSLTNSVAVLPPVPPFLIDRPQSTSALLTWYDHNFFAEATLGYRVQRAPDAGGHPGAWAQITSVDGGFDNYNYMDTGLTIAATYWYRVQAFNWVGNSDFGDPYSITVIPPSQPSWGAAGIDVTNHQVDLYWQDNAADEDGFTIERAPDQHGVPGAWSQIGSVYATNSSDGSFSDTNAVAYTTNWYRVRAFSASGTSEYSAPLDVDILPPSAPQVSAQSAATQITLSWYNPVSYLQGEVGYKVERALDVNGNPGAWTQLTNTIDLSYTNNNLTPDTTYWYRVRSYNWVGDSDFSDPINVTITPPSRPSGLFGAVGTNNTVYLQWDDFDQGEDGFKIERAADGGGYPEDTWQEIGTVNAPMAQQGSFVDTNIVAYTTNWYRVRAFNAAGLSDIDGDAMVRVIPPDAPYDTSASVNKNTAQIFWYWNFSLGFEGSGGGFIIQRAPDAGGVPGTWADITTNTDFGESYFDAGLPTGATYWYRVRAFNWVGSSDSDLPVSVTVPGPTAATQPSAPEGFPRATNQVFLFWSDNAGDEEGFKIQRAPDVDGAPGNWTEIGNIYVTNLSSAGFTDTNVTANSTNWYRVQAFNNVGASMVSDSNRVWVVAPATAPRMTDPSIIAAHRIDVRWQADYGVIQGYNLERAPDAAGTPGAWAVMANLPSTDTLDVYSDITVVANKKYWYRVQSYNWAGSSPYSDPLLISDATPGAPVLAVTNDQPNHVTLTWTRTANDISSVLIERAPDNGGVPGVWIQIDEKYLYSGVNPTNYIDIGVPTGQAFWYRVRAVNIVGDSPYSNEASSAIKVSQPPTPAQILSLTPANGGLFIEWSTTGGDTDIVEASGSVFGNYTNASPPLLISGSGSTTTNYFEAGVMTNASPRFYRIRSSR